MLWRAFGEVQLWPYTFSGGDGWHSFEPLLPKSYHTRDLKVLEKGPSSSKRGER